MRLTVSPLPLIRSVAMLALLATLLSGGSVSSQETATGEAAKAEAVREARLAYLKERAADFRLVAGVDRVARMSPPIYRWSHPVGTTLDGASFVWMDDERPVAIGSVLILRDGTSYGEFQSLTSGPLKAVRKGVVAWEPARSGCDFRPVPQGPKPGETAAERLTQMKSLARRFSAELTKGPPHYPADSIWRLRMLPKQLVRYGGPRGNVLDGAIFAFCHDTDVEAILVLEAGGENADREWRFAFAPFCGWPGTGKCDDTVVWSHPQLAPMNASKQPYMVFIPTPSFRAETILQEASK